MRRRLVFIDDDKTELAEFRKIVAQVYNYTAIHWPAESRKLFTGPAPDIFVCDLHLPGRPGDSRPTPNQRAAASKAARRVAQRFADLYPEPRTEPDTLLNDKARLKETMGAVLEAYRLLELQKSSLGQSSDNGIALLREIRRWHPDVPFVFYSRKITPEEVIRVLKAGATDAIRKGVLRPEEILERLAMARKLWDGKDLREIRARGLNANITIVHGPAARRIRARRKR